MTVRARLLKVVVQPVFVVDDGDDIEEVAADAVTIPGKGWAEFAANGLNDEVLSQVAAQYVAKQEASSPNPAGPDHLST